MADNGNAGSGFLTLKEAASILRIHPETLRDYLRRNKKNRPPIVRPAAKRRLFPKDEFLEWAKQQRG
jgi:excisionase family DNA binding protein